MAIPELKTSVFILPETVTKTSTERAVVLNANARRVIESRPGKHSEFVFTYRGHPVGKLNNSAWKRGWRQTGLPVEAGVRKGVHNLRHTFGRRLRSAGVPLETRKALLGHANGDITTRYSAAELNELKKAVEKIVDQRVAQTPTLTIGTQNTCGCRKSVDTLRSLLTAHGSHHVQQIRQLTPASSSRRRRPGR